MYFYSEILVEQDDTGVSGKSIIDATTNEAVKVFDVKGSTALGLLKTAAIYKATGKVDKKELIKAGFPYLLSRFVTRVISEVKNVSANVKSLYRPINLPQNIAEDITFTPEELYVLTEADDTKSGGLFSRVRGKLRNLWKRISLGGVLTVLIFILGLTLFFTLVLAVVSEGVYKRFIAFTKWLERVAIPKVIRRAEKWGTHVVTKTKTEKGEEKEEEEPYEEELGSEAKKQKAEIFFMHKMSLTFHDAMFLLRKYVGRARTNFEARSKECKTKEKFFEKLWCYVKAYFASIKTIVSSGTGDDLKVVHVIKIFAAPIVFIGLMLGRPISWASSLFKKKDETEKKAKEKEGEEEAKKKAEEAEV